MKTVEYFRDIWSILQPISVFYNQLVYFTTHWCILQPIGVFYNHLVYFTTIWYILWCIFPVLVCCTKKNLATLVHAGNSMSSFSPRCPSVLRDYPFFCEED
jgi:hypothetical protein